MGLAGGARSDQPLRAKYESPHLSAANTAHCKKAEDLSAWRRNGPNEHFNGERERPSTEGMHQKCSRKRRRRRASGAGLD